MGLTLLVLRIALCATEPIQIDEYAGSSLRGALFHALLRRFCMNPTATQCMTCDLNQTCPVAGLISPLRDERPRGRDVPRPFVLTTERASKDLPCTDQAESSEGIKIEPEQRFSFDLTLIGQAIRYLPYVVLSVPLLESSGVGKPVSTNGGRRGRFHVEQIDLVDPLAGTASSGERTQRLYTRGEAKVAKPELMITPQQVTARARELAAAAAKSGQFTIRFLTPTRLIADGLLVHKPDFRILALRLAERVEALERAYGAASVAGSLSADGDVALTEEERAAARARYTRIGQAAAQIKLVSDETRWVNVASYSARQHRATPIGGFVGRATFALPAEHAQHAGAAPHIEIPDELWEALVWGEALHVGKNAVKGDGLYRIQAVGAGASQTPSQPSIHRRILQTCGY